MSMILMKKFAENLKRCHWGWFIILWSFLQIFMIWYHQTFILTYDSLEETLGNRFSPVQIDLYFTILQDVTYKIYFLLPVMILMRAVIMALIIHLFLLLRNQYTSLKTLIWVTSLNFGIFVVRDIVQIVMASRADMTASNGVDRIYMPLSLMSVPGLNVNQGFIRLFNQINLFEIIWFCFSIFFISALTQKNPGKICFPILSARVFVIICLWGLGVFYEIYML